MAKLGISPSSSENAAELCSVSRMESHCRLAVNGDRITHIVRSRKDAARAKPHKSLKERKVVVRNALREIAITCRSYDTYMRVVEKLVREKVLSHPSEGEELFQKERLEAEALFKEFESLGSYHAENAECEEFIERLVREGRLPSKEAGWHLVMRARLPTQIKIFESIAIVKGSWSEEYERGVEEDLMEVIVQAVEEKELPSIECGVNIVKIERLKKLFFANPSLDKFTDLYLLMQSRDLLCVEPRFWEAVLVSLASAGCPNGDLMEAIHLLSSNGHIDRTEAFELVVDEIRGGVVLEEDQYPGLEAATKRIHEFFKPDSPPNIVDKGFVPPTPAPSPPLEDLSVTAGRGKARENLAKREIEDESDRSDGEFEPDLDASDSEGLLDEVTAKGLPGHASDQISPTPSVDSLHIEVARGGTSGVYFIHDETSTHDEKQRLAVLKPLLEEPFTPGNPLGLHLSPQLPELDQTCGYTPGECGYRERGCYVLCNLILKWDLVPPTKLVDVPFRETPISLVKPPMTPSPESPVVEKKGSLQQFVPGFLLIDKPHLLERVPIDDLHRAGLYQLLVDASDGGAANIMFTVPEGTEDVRRGDDDFERNAKVVIFDNGRSLGPQMFERSSAFTHFTHSLLDSILVHQRIGMEEKRDLSGSHYGGTAVWQRVSPEIVQEFKRMGGRSELEVRSLLRNEGISHEAISAMCLRHKMISVALDEGYSVERIGNMMRKNIDKLFSEAQEKYTGQSNFPQLCEDYIFEQWVLIVHKER